MSLIIHDSPTSQDLSKRVGCLATIFHHSKVKFVLITISLSIVDETFQYFCTTILLICLIYCLVFSDNNDD